MLTGMRFDPHCRANGQICRRHEGPIRLQRQQSDASRRVRAGRNFECGDRANLAQILTLLIAQLQLPLALESPEPLPAAAH
jgi:hypothetical protein